MISHNSGAIKLISIHSLYAEGDQRALEIPKTVFTISIHSLYAEGDDV